MSPNEGPLSGLRVPEPPHDLRRQVLNRAKQAPRTEAHNDSWVRLWESRRARLVWAAAVLALAVCHVALPGGDAESPSERPTLARAAADDQEELDVIANLPRISLDARSVAAGGGALEESDTYRDPGAESEKNAS